MSAPSTTESSSSSRIRSAAQVVPDGQATRQIRCKLCSGPVAVDNTFRPANVACPHCGLTFAYDPLRRPLPIRGVKLRYADVAAAQRKPGRRQAEIGRSQPLAVPHYATPSPLSRASWLGLAFAAGILVCRYFLKSMAPM